MLLVIAIAIAAAHVRRCLLTEIYVLHIIHNLVTSLRLRPGMDREYPD